MHQVDQVVYVLPEKYRRLYYRAMPKTCTCRMAGVSTSYLSSLVLDTIIHFKGRAQITTKGKSLKQQQQ